MAIIRKALRGLMWAIIFVNVSVTVLITLMLLADIISRNVRGRSLPGTYDMTEVAMLLITATALLWLDAERDNIGFSVLIDRFSERWQNIIEVCWRVLLLPFFGVMVYFGWNKMLEALARNESRQGLLELPMWPARLIVAVTFAMLIVLSVFYIIDAIRTKKIVSLIERDDATDEEIA